MSRQLASKTISVLTAGQIEQALRTYYEKFGNTLISQVRNGTGFSREPRTADMLMFSTWPSRGLYCDGVEIKVNRSDLIRELRNPKKADDIAQYCSHWWVAGPEGLISEQYPLPEKWGFLSVSPTLRVRVVKQAQLLKPNPMDALMVCSVMRRFAQSHVPLASIQDRIDEAVKQANAKAHNSYSDRLAGLEQCIKEFELHSGISLLTDSGRPKWEVGRIGDAVKSILALRGMPAEELQEARIRLAMGVEAVDQALKMLGMVNVVAPSVMRDLQMARRKQKFSHAS